MMKKFGAAWLLAVCVSVAMAQQPASRVEKQNDEILSELKAIRALLEKMASASPAAPAGAPERPAPIKIPALPSSYTEGRDDAPVTIVEFTDLQCPFCRQFRLSAFPALRQQYIDTGKVRFLSFDFPLSSIHPLAEAAAKASRCAAEQKKGSEMRAAILMNNDQLKPDTFLALAKDLGLQLEPFSACTADAARFATERKANEAYAKTAGVDGTPTFVIAKTASPVLDGMRLVGALPAADFQVAVEKILAEIAASGKAQ